MELINASTHLPEGSCLKDLSVAKQKSYRFIPSRGLAISHYIDPQNTVEMAETSDHFICCLIEKQSERQKIKIEREEYSGSRQKGDICIKPAAASGFWSWDDVSHSLLFGVNHDFLKQMAAEDDLLNPDAIEILPILRQNDSQISHLAALFQQEIDTHTPGNSMYLESLGNILGIHLLRNYCSRSARDISFEGKLPAYKLRQIIDFIDSYMADDISLQELATEVKLSQSHFSTLFRATTGRSPHQFLIEKRLERAQNLLLETDMKISDIAITVGFYDQSHMSRHLKRKVGLSPRKLRQQCL